MKIAMWKFMMSKINEMINSLILGIINKEGYLLILLLVLYEISQNSFYSCIV